MKPNLVKCVCLLLTACLAGCASQRIVAPIASRIDSTAIHVLYSIKYRPLLVEFNTPDIRETRVTRDTTSTLENDYAESTATVSNGVLTHSLNTKPHTETKEVQVPHERTDSTIYVYQEVVKIKEVATPLTWWQETQIKGFWAMISLLGVIVLLKVIRAKFGGVLGLISNLFKGI